MRLTSLALKTVGLLAVYAFACGALDLPQTAGGGGEFLDRLLAPLGDITPTTGSFLIAGLFLFAAGIVIEPGFSLEGDRRPGRSLFTRLLLAAFLINSLAVCGVVAVLFVGFRTAGDQAGLGAFYAAGVLQAMFGTVLAVALYFFQRPRLVYLPTLGLFFAGIAALGAMFWFGNGALP